MAKRWTSDEETILKNIYPISSKKEITEKIHRAWPQIRVKATELELKRDSQLITNDRKIRNGKRSDSWTEEEINFLKEIFQINSKKFILEEFKKRKYDRSWQSINVTARNMGIRRNPDILKQEIIENSKKGIKKLNSSGIMWTEPENKILTKFYSISPQSDMEEKLPGRTFRAIREQALKLGLMRNKSVVDQDRALHLQENYGVKSTWQLKCKLPRAQGPWL
jgi:hypothetical protein